MSSDEKEVGRAKGLRAEPWQLGGALSSAVHNLCGCSCVQVVAWRLKTHLGGASQTFAAFEKALGQARAALASQASHPVS
jgi:hypothetical protein